MTNRELLEAAARAADNGAVWFSGLGMATDTGRTIPLTWNPLENDGDALRLAVKLGLCFGPNFDGDLAVCFGSNGRNITEPFGSDPCAATRRVIVLAAAALAPTTPPKEQQP